MRFILFSLNYHILHIFRQAKRGKEPQKDRGRSPHTLISIKAKRFVQRILFHTSPDKGRG